MSKSELTINAAGMDKAFGDLRHRILEKSADKLEVLQKQQVADAFRDNGPPGSKWKPMWADKFIGRAPQAKVEAWEKAKTAYVKASGKVQRGAKARTAGLRASKEELLRFQFRKADARFDKASVALKKARATSYRRGGQALRDNGQLMGSFYSKPRQIFDTYAVVTLESSAFYAAYHQNGFKTKGPNFIPLTTEARTLHSLGADPEKEGLQEGIDYIMAWHGVTVPARPMIDYDDPANLAQIKQALTNAAREASRG